MSEHGLSPDQFTIAVVCAMFFERAAFRNMLDEEYSVSFPKVRGDNNHYRLGRIGPHNVVLASMSGEQGIGTAAIALKDLVRTFPAIRWRLLVGVGGGVPSPLHDIRLGDVVVSMPDHRSAHGGVAQYDVGKEIDGEFRLKGFLAQPPRHLRSAVESMREDHERDASRIGEFLEAMLSRFPKLQEKYGPQDPSTDILFQDGVPHASAHGAPCDDCDASRIIYRPPRRDGLPQIHYGLVASGNQVVVSTEARDSFINRLRGDVLCFEMEAAGIAADDVGCLIIRGISNYAGPHKVPGWEFYAAATAAACAKELLLLVQPEEVDMPMPDTTRWAAGYLPSSSGSGDEDDKSGLYMLEGGQHAAAGSSRDSGLFQGGSHNNMSNFGGGRRNMSQEEVYSNDSSCWVKAG